jgi:NAD(P)-dependent dehydrogenase (short-subunit alcohol dehydrogenase family)
MSDLRNQVAVVTGGSSGIGRAVAAALAEQGAVVCLVGRRASKLEEAAGLVSSKTPQAGCYPCDLGNPAEIEALCGRIGRDHPHVDILIHSAAFFSMGTIDAADARDLDKHYEVNVRGPYLLTKMLLPIMAPAPGTASQIVFINSTAGHQAHGGVSQYAASKFALKALADSLREELNPKGYRIVSVYPGRTATPLLESICRMQGTEYIPEDEAQPEDIAAVALAALTLPLTAEITDVTVRPHRPPKGKRLERG